MEHDEKVTSNRDSYNATQLLRTAKSGSVFEAFYDSGLQFAIDSNSHLLRGESYRHDVEDHHF
jgi:hypothetical protein